MRNKHFILVWLCYALMSGIVAQTLDKQDLCYTELRGLAAKRDTLNKYKIARYQQCMRQVGYTQAQASKLFGNYSCFPHNDTFLNKHPAYFAKTPDG